MALDFACKTDNQTLETLLQAIRVGDKQALADLYGCTADAVYAFALSILKNSHDAEDVLHDCYVNIFRSAVSYRPMGKPMAWILAIARNLSYTLLRDRSKTVELSETAWLNLSAHETTSEDRAILQACMDCLSERERQIVVLHAVAGFKHRETADFLGLTLSNVLSTYHRSIKKMKRRVQE